MSVNVISRIRALCAAVSRDLCFNNASFETEVLKNLKNRIFKSISSFIERIKNDDVIFHVFRVIEVTLTNDEKTFEENSSKSIYDFIVTLQQKDEFVKLRRDEFVKTTQHKSDRFFKSMYFLDENELLRYHDKTYVFDKASVQAAFLKRYYDDGLTKHLKADKTVKLFARKYY